MRATASASGATGRTQAERRAGTRRRLLDAAVATLIARGIGGTTTTAVCRRAGVSQGALFKHFPSKGALMAATAAHLFEAVLADYRRALEDAGAAARDPIGAAVDALFALFEQPRLVAVFDLYAAARTDRLLRAALGPVMEQHTANVDALARELLPWAAGEPERLGVLVALAVSAAQGAAVSALAAPTDQRTAAMRELVKRLGREAFDAGQAG